MELSKDINIAFKQHMPHCHGNNNASTACRTAVHFQQSGRKLMATDARSLHFEGEVRAWLQGPAGITVPSFSSSFV